MLQYKPIIQTIFVAVICLFIAGYAYSRTIDVIKGPEINISSPISGSKVDENLVTVEGTALRIAKLHLNGKQIFTDEQGNFKESLLVPQGYSTLYVKAVDMFDRSTTKTISLVH